MANEITDSKEYLSLDASSLFRQLSSDQPCCSLPPSYSLLGPVLALSIHTRASSRPITCFLLGHTRRPHNHYLLADTFQPIRRIVLQASQQRRRPETLP